MSTELLRDNWALAAAAAVVLVILLLVLLRAVSGSGTAQLRKVRKHLSVQRGRLHKAEAALAQASRRVQVLKARAEKVKPRVLQEAIGKTADAEALARIARDTVLIAEQRMRQIIHEEFPPAKQARLRDKYLPESPPDKRPFSF